MTVEQSRIEEHYSGKVNWLKWGPYLSERQWGTVREDYSANGDAWNYISHDMARSKAYRWGEDGLAGFCDEHQQICLSLALWNGRDAILKERLFGLTNYEGNHGEDVKELYYYLDATPSHSYQKFLYKYPQSAFPYTQLVEENRKRSKTEPEYELIDTGIFDDDRYFDIFIEYAKNETDDILVLYTIHNRSHQPADLHVLPQLWFRNTWHWNKGSKIPLITNEGENTLWLHSEVMGDFYCYADSQPEFLFTHNETNKQRLYNAPNDSPFVKDGFHERIIHNREQAVNPQLKGTKAGVWYYRALPPEGSCQIRLRLVNKKQAVPFADFDSIVEAHRQQSDAFYESRQAAALNEDEKRIQRQAWAGLLCNKQFYCYNIHKWLTGDPNEPSPPTGHAKSRNFQWKHFVAANIISMPDKWEYPWFAAWDLAFHCMAIAPIDSDFAKNQLRLLLRASFMHPNGQLPAYEWDFNDVNPPVHALAAWKVFLTDRELKGKADYPFLEEIFQKLLLNFTWWVNRKDSEGSNIFEGGFLGLDNIGIFNRSAPAPGGGLLEQADGTSWMAMYALNMTQIAMELGAHNKVYEKMAIKFAEHFFFIAGSISHMGEDSLGLWDDKDGFYYDLLRKPDGSWDRLRLRTLVGLIPMLATIIFDEAQWSQLPLFKERLDEFISERPDLTDLTSPWKDKKGGGKHLLSLLKEDQLKQLLQRMLDPDEFLSDYGIRSVSKIYGTQPYQYWLNGEDYSIHYIPGESDNYMFGGNSNWRGPVWIPINFLIIEVLHTLHEYYTADFKVEFPAHSGNYSSLKEIADALSGRLRRIFLRNEYNERPFLGRHPKLNHDPHFKDYLLFHEYFHGDTGKGLGASHQTGWTALVAILSDHKNEK